MVMKGNGSRKGLVKGAFFRENNPINVMCMMTRAAKMM